MNKKPYWIEINAPGESERPIVPVVPIHLFIFVNNEYIMPEACIVGEIKQRQVYEEIPAEYHAWLSDYRTSQKVWIGRFKTLSEAKKQIEDDFRSLLDSE